MTATAHYITGISHGTKFRLSGPFQSPTIAAEIMALVENMNWQECPAEFSRSYPMPHHRRRPEWLYISEDAANLSTWLGAGIGNFSDVAIL
jgi:hypothetical protein